MNIYKQSNAEHVNINTITMILIINACPIISLFLVACDMILMMVRLNVNIVIPQKH